MQIIHLPLRLENVVRIPPLKCSSWVKGGGVAGQMKAGFSTGTRGGSAPSVRTWRAVLMEGLM